MNRRDGEKIVAAMKGVDVALEKVFVTLEGIEDNDERKKLIRNYFFVMSEAHVKSTVEVVKQFPDLHPDKHLWKGGSSDDQR